MHIAFTAHFAKYCSHPYWAEREQVIQIQKESGLNRARSQANRTRALSTHLAKIGLSMEDYGALLALADRPFHLAAGVIIIPQHQVYGCLAQAADLASSSLRLAAPEQIRTVLKSTDWVTTKTAGDGVWSRFVVVKAGSGQTLSNQRSLRENAYLEDFDVTATLTFSADVLQPEKVQQFLAFAGRDIGIGASRKLDWGRFAVTGFVEVPHA